mmetsp:Transcript_21257/g.41612  ORF Transcript_21257/g.41612 Transcript_21257/m.41612 type:complete len:296 (+) Transcript_21257:151-1038(+)
MQQLLLMLLQRRQPHLRCQSLRIGDCREALYSSDFLVLVLVVPKGHQWLQQPPLTATRPYPTTLRSYHCCALAAFHCAASPCCCSTGVLGARQNHPQCQAPQWKEMRSAVDSRVAPVLPVFGPASSKAAMFCRDCMRPLACHHVKYTHQGRHLGAHRGVIPACRCQGSRHTPTYRCSLRRRDRRTQRPLNELGAHVRPGAALSRAVHPAHPRPAPTHPKSQMLEGRQSQKSLPSSPSAHGPSALAQQSLLPRSIPEQNYLKTRLRHEDRLVPKQRCGPNHRGRGKCGWHGLHQCV